MNAKETNISTLSDQEQDAYDVALDFCARASSDPIEHNKAVDRLLKLAVSIALARGDDIGVFNDLVSQVTNRKS